MGLGLISSHGKSCHLCNCHGEWMKLQGQAESLEIGCSCITLSELISVDESPLNLESLRSRGESSATQYLSESLGVVKHKPHSGCRLAVISTAEDGFT